jgi:hypothetical protein
MVLLNKGTLNYFFARNPCKNGLLFFCLCLVFFLFLETIVTDCFVIIIVQTSSPS